MAIDLEVVVYAVRSGLEGILIVPVSVLGVISYVTVRRRRDPARKGIIWLHFAFALHFFAYLFGSLGYALWIIYTRDTRPLLSTSRITTFDAQLRLVPLSTFLRKLGDCCIMFCISGIGAGVWRVTKGKKIPGFYVPIQILGGIIALLAFVVFVRLEYAATESLELLRGSRGNFDVRDFGNVEAVTVILLLLGASATVFFAIVVKTQARLSAGTVLRTPTTLLLVSALLNVLIQGWGTAFVAWRLARNSSGVLGIWFVIADLVIDRYGAFVQLVLLFVLASKKVNGLWTTSQPWTETQIQQVYVAHPYAPASEPEVQSPHSGPHSGRQTGQTYSHPVEIFTPSVQVYSQRNRGLVR